MTEITFQYADGNNSVKKNILIQHKERTDEVVILGRWKGIGPSEQVKEIGLKWEQKVYPWQSKEGRFTGADTGTWLDTPDL